MDSIKSFFASPFSVEGLLAMIVLLLFLILQAIKAVSGQLAVLIKMRFPELLDDN